MSERDDAVRAVYLAARIDDQLAFYESRALEYSRAREQAVTVRTWLLGLAAVSGAVSAVLGPGARVVLGIVGALLAALAAAVTGFEALIGFEQLAKLYTDAAANLRLEAVGWSRSTQPLGEDVTRVEAVLAREAAQWGQLRSREVSARG